jgi:glutamate-1-semialdehyde aminotransferase
MVAGIAALERYDSEAITRLSALTARTTIRLNAEMKSAGITGIVTSVGSLFRVLLHSRAQGTYRENYPAPADLARQEMLRATLMQHGIFFGIGLFGSFSTAMGENEADFLVERFATAIRNLPEEWHALAER